MGSGSPGRGRDMSSKKKKGLLSKGKKLLKKLGAVKWFMCSWTTCKASSLCIFFLNTKTRAFMTMQYNFTTPAFLTLTSIESSGLLKTARKKGFSLNYKKTNTKPKQQLCGIKTRRTWFCLKCIQHLQVLDKSQPLVSFNHMLGKKATINSLIPTSEIIPTVSNLTH